MSAGHTPAPWSFDGPASSIIVWGPDPDIRVCFMTSDGPAKENAALIVRAVNAHDELVEALRQVLRDIDAIAGGDQRPGHIAAMSKAEMVKRAERSAAVIDAALSKALGNDGGEG